MFMNEYLVKQDITLIRELCGISRSNLADVLSVSISTMERWENEEVTISDTNKETLYSYAFSNNIQLNKIKAQLIKNGCWQLPTLEENFKIMKKVFISKILLKK